jgi:hypothetical protein
VDSAQLASISSLPPQPSESPAAACTAPAERSTSPPLALAPSLADPRHARRSEGLYVCESKRSADLTAAAAVAAAARRCAVGGLWRRGPIIVGCFCGGAVSSRPSQRGGGPAAHQVTGLRGAAYNDGAGC